MNLLDLFVPNKPLPKADCDNCFYKDFGDDGGHCYMFRNPPGEFCGQFKQHERKVPVRQWRFFEIEAGDKEPIAQGDLTPITPEQCVEAIQQTRDHGGKIELYLTNEPWDGDAPLVGLVFEKGQYVNFGLGSDETGDLQKLCETQYKGKPVPLQVFQDAIV